MFKKTIPQHKRIAQGGAHTPLSYARGGSVKAPAVNGSVPAVGTGGSASPLTTARRNNGVKGMKDGGKC